MSVRLPVALGSVVVAGIGASGAGAATLFALVDTGELFASTDEGVTWAIHSTLPVRDAVGLLRGASGSELYLASESGSVYLSGDGGSSWSAVGAIPASDVVAIDVGTRGQLSLLALTATGTLWQSTDGGVSFSALATLTASDHVSLTHDANGTLCALTETGTIRESSDGGASWSAVGALPVSDAVEVQPRGSDLLVLTGAGDVWESTDSGWSWSAIGTLSQVHMSGMILGEPGMLFASTREGEVAASSDGTTWAWVGLINQLNVVALATDLAPTGVERLDLPSGAVSLSPPWPNPSVGWRSSRFELKLPGPATVRLSLYDVRGREVVTRAPEAFPTGGTHGIEWNPGLRTSGVYWVRLTTDAGRSAATRWVLIR